MVAGPEQATHRTGADAQEFTSTDRAVLAKLSRFARMGLVHLPTPLESMTRLAAYLGGPRLWVKPEDATGIGFGGNKLRKRDLYEEPDVKDANGNAVITRVLTIMLAEEY